MGRNVGKAIFISSLVFWWKNTNSRHIKTEDTKGHQSIVLTLDLEWDG